MFVYKKANEYKTHILIPLLVLLWKYAVMRTHRYCHSFWEIFGGISLFLILFLIYQTSIDEHTDHGPAPNKDSTIRVFYRPSNNLTQRLMTRVGDYLTINDDVQPKQQWDFESILHPVDETLLNTSFHGFAVVDFKNNGSLTPDLEYTISVISGEKKNNLNKGFGGFFRSISPKAKIAPPYLGTLQWAIDKSYIEQLTDQGINQLVQFISVPKYISEELHTLHKFMIICTIVGPLPFFLVYSAGLIEERRCGLRELMKLSGVCSDALRFSHILETTLIGILYSIPVTIVLKITSTPILPHSNSFLLTITLILHFVNTMALAFITTALSQDFHHADCLGLLLYMSTVILDFLWYSYKEYTFMIYILCCILPHAPIYLYWDEVLFLETIGQGSQFSNLHIRHSDNCMSVTRVWLLFYVQLAVITTVAWYLDLVRPGYYGVSKRWNFMFKKTYWCWRKTRRIIIDPNAYVKRDQNFFEQGPKKAELAIQVYNVAKVFKQSGHKTQVIALRSITFDCYKGEVTMVLGANGAGKTTLMLIVAGMFSPTEGTVYVNGMDVAHRVMELREDVGLCMQQNICFRFLTVKENITFFKKLRRKQSEGFTVDQLIKKLKLADVADYYSMQLSTGALRCLQVACVLAGDAEVLVLDEPTTGMDVEARHRLWDLLMVLRGNKTILMTTSSLEEANALGDRIVILNNGTLKCHGTPTFLKNAIGTSFNLSLIIKDSSQMMQLKEMVDKIIPDLNCKIHDTRRITFSLPSKDFRQFPELFKALEEKKEEFGITLMDVGMFMEEVFSKFIEREELGKYSIQLNTSLRRKYMLKQDFRTDRTKGFRLVLTQMRLLNKRVFDYFMTKKYQFVILRMLIPVLCLIIISLTTNYSLRHDKIFSHQITGHYHNQYPKLVYNVGPFRRRALFTGLDKYPGVEAVYSLDIDREFRDPSAGYMNKETVGLKITDNYTKIFHPVDPHSTTRSVNMFSNIYLSIFMPFLNNTIRTTYEPMADPLQETIKIPKSAFLCLKWTSWVTFLAILPLTPIIILCIAELKSGIRDHHMMAGCTPLIYWGSKLQVHMLVFMAVIVAPVIVVGVLLDFDRTFAQTCFLGSVFALLITFALAFLTNLYLLSFLLHENYAISQIYITSMFFGVILPILLSVLEPAWDTSIFIAIPYFIVVAIGRISPMFPFGVGLGRLTLQARLNAFCSLNKRSCPNLVFDLEIGFDSELCCGSPALEPFPYLSTYDSGLCEILNLLVHFIVFSTLVILLEYRIPQYLHEQFSFVNYKQPQQKFHDQSVRREITYVRTMTRARNYKDDVLLVDNLHKDYANEIRSKRKLNAVKGITFAAKTGECLAILGTQATGKSSVLNMLAGNLVMTRGNSHIQGAHIRTNRMKYIHKISLTSSAGGMDSFMSGQQNLIFIAKLKGYSDNMAYKLALMALRYMGLEANNIEVSKYSSGCLRRLSLCSTLVLAPDVAFLDEPMREIDESSKPLVAKALQRIMLEPAAVIVAETSLDWRLLQSVFTRIAIMSKGQFAAIGPAEEVLRSVAQGYTARIKLKMVTAYRKDKYRVFADDEESSDSESDTDDIAIHSEKSVMYAQRVNDFKAEFLKIFTTSRVMGEHLCMLYFYIQDDDNTQLYSDMFIKLQELKEKFPDVVDDYYLNSTTVEDVFWRLEHDKDAENLIVSPLVAAS